MCSLGRNVCMSSPKMAIIPVLEFASVRIIFMSLPTALSAYGSLHGDLIYSVIFLFELTPFS